MLSWLFLSDDMHSMKSKNKIEFWSSGPHENLLFVKNDGQVQFEKSDMKLNMFELVRKHLRLHVADLFTYAYG